MYSLVKGFHFIQKGLAMKKILMTAVAAAIVCVSLPAVAAKAPNANTVSKPVSKPVIHLTPSEYLKVLVLSSGGFVWKAPMLCRLCDADNDD
jgi:hypothetical protein